MWRTVRLQVSHTLIYWITCNTCDTIMQGLGQTVAFCGDGLNDLAALVTAEVGLAIGPLDAMAAAPVSTKQSSISGLLHCMSP